MNIDNIFNEVATVSTAAENLDYLYNKLKDSGDKLHYMLKKIIGNWFTEIHSKLGTGATSHKDMNKLATLISYAELYIKAKNKDDEETMEFSKPVYNKVIKEIKNKFSLKEATVGEILQSQKDFQYQLKKKGKKYYIYKGNKRVYSKGVEELNKLASIVRPWLKETSITFGKWSEKAQRKIIKRYIEQFKKTLEEK